MSQVLIHNEAHPSQAAARDAQQTRAEVAANFYWNLWRRALPPWANFSDGVRVLLLESWPGGAFLSWDTEATQVSVARFPTKMEAVTAIAHWAGKSVPWVLGDPYTAGKPADAGVVLYWRPRPIRRLDLPKPPELKVRRNGWLVTDYDQLASWGLSLEPTAAPHQDNRQHPDRRRAGRRLDVEARVAVEQRAMRVAKEWARKQRWTGITDVSRGNSQGSKSWDLEAVDTLGRRRYLEVKGTTGGLGDVEVTRGEVDAGRQHGLDHSLVVVHQIHLTTTGDRFTASGGIAKIYNPWLPDKRELVATRYRWRRQ